MEEQLTIREKVQAPSGSHQEPKAGATAAAPGPRVTRRKLVGAAMGGMGLAALGVMACASPAAAADETVAGDLYVQGPRPWADVRANGAEGDGSADDTDAVNAAISQVASTGGVVYFPIGIYKITSTLAPVLQGGSISFLGAGGASTIKWGGAAGGTMLTLTGNFDTQNINNAGRIQGLTFDGNRDVSYSKRADTALELIDIGFMVIEQCQFTYLSGDAIYGHVGDFDYGVLHTTVRNCWFGLGAFGDPVDGYGIHFVSPHSCTIAENEFYFTRGGSVKLVAGDGNRIISNDFEGLLDGTSAHSIDLVGGARGLIAFNRHEEGHDSAESRDIRALYFDAASPPIYWTVIGNDYGEVGGSNTWIEVAGGSQGISFIGNHFAWPGLESNIRVSSSTATHLWDVCNNHNMFHAIDGDSATSMVSLFSHEYPFGFDKLSINRSEADMEAAPNAALDVRGVALTDGIGTRNKTGGTGVPNDSELGFTGYAFPGSFLMTDDVGHRFWARFPGGSWHSVNLIDNGVLSNDATGGFTYVPTMDGRPTTAPEPQGSNAPIVVDSSADKLWVYVGGAWKSAALR